MTTFDDKRKPAHNDKTLPGTGGLATQPPKKGKKAVGKSVAQIRSRLPLVEVKTCKICMSPYRTDIEKLLVYGMSQREVIRQYAQLGTKINKNSLSNHSIRHMSVRKAAIRQMIEAQYQKQIGDIEEATGVMLTTRSILEVVRQKGFEQVVEGAQAVAPTDLFKAMEKLDQLDQSDEGEKIAEMMQELNCLLRAVQDIVQPEIWGRIVKQFETNLEAAKNPGKPAQLPAPAPNEDAER